MQSDNQTVTQKQLPGTGGSTVQQNRLVGPAAAGLRRQHCTAITWGKSDSHAQEAAPQSAARLKLRPAAERRKRHLTERRPLHLTPIVGRTTSGTTDRQHIPFLLVTERGVGRSTPLSANKFDVKCQWRSTNGEIPGRWDTRCQRRWLFDGKSGAKRPHHR